MNHEIDDHRIEKHLRSFRPLPAAPLPGRKGQWKLAILSAAAVLAIGALALLPRFRTAAPVLPEPQVLTMGRANRLLANSPSWTDVIDDAGFAFRTTRTTPPNRTSALEFLSQEDLSR